MKRKIVQIAAAEAMDGEGNVEGTLYALTDDGIVWLMIDPWSDDRKWLRLPVTPERKDD